MVALADLITQQFDGHTFASREARGVLPPGRRSPRSDQGLVDADYIARTGDTAYRIGQRIVIREAAVRESLALTEKLTPVWLTTPWRPARRHRDRRQTGWKSRLSP